MKSQKVFIILFSLSLLFFSNNVFADNEDDPIKKEGVKVIISIINQGDATIKWFDQNIDFIEIVSNNGQMMPPIPVLDADALYLHDLADGIYLIHFKSEGKTSYSKQITVQR